MYSRVFITGVVRYNPDKCWNGLTIIPGIQGTDSAQGAALYDMNGNVVHRWKGLYGAFDNKILPGGHVMGASGFMPGYWLDCLDLIQQDWDGNTVWRFDKGEALVNPETGKSLMSARQHHDFQREGSATGYYNPGQTPKTRGKTLVNSTLTRKLPEFSDINIADTNIMEVDEEGNRLWSWSLFDHWDQLGIESIGKAVHRCFAPEFGTSGYVKVTYCNNINYLGPNKWHDAGDERFHPDNIISDIRILNTSFIIDRKSGDIVWRLGPDFESCKELQDIGQIVGQHHVHMIQKGLPGEGNILIFDNGGQAGLGKPSPCAPTGYCNATRAYSRVLEIDPVTLKVVWSYNDPSEFPGSVEELTITDNLFSHYCSSADRLPNGNTLITEFLHGRIIEVTPEREIVWEFINPAGKVFRAHRYPYSWCPQVTNFQEEAVTPVHNSRLRLNTRGEPVLMPEDEFFTAGADK